MESKCVEPLDPSTCASWCLSTNLGSATEPMPVVEAGRAKGGRREGREMPFLVATFLMDEF